VERIEGTLGGLTGKTLAVWGLAFKPRTDDVREAPALALIEQVVSRGAKVRAMDPEALETAQVRLIQAGVADRVALFADAYEALDGADALVIATEWSQFRSPDAERMKQKLRGVHVFDGRNALTADDMLEVGLVYHGIGRPELKR